MREFVATEYVTGFYEYKVDVTEKLVEEMNEYYISKDRVEKYVPLTLEDVELILDEEFSMEKIDKEFSNEIKYMVIDYIREEAFNVNTNFEWTNTDDIEYEFRKEI